MNAFKKSMLVFAVVLLAACGGGGSNTATEGRSVVSVLITDAVSDQYAKVWVTVLKVTAEDSNGAPVTLYDNPDGLVVNLSELNGVAALLNTQNLTPGAYSNFQVTLANEVSLVERVTGRIVPAAFNAAGYPEVVPVQGNITIGSGTGTITIDFDLKQFNYDSTTGLVTPVLILKNDIGNGRSASGKLDRTYAEVEGTVREITDGVSFVLQPKHGSVSLRVNLLPATTIYDYRDGSVSSDAGVLVPELRVEVYGNYDPVVMTVDAVRIEIKGAGNSTAPSAMNHAKVEGWVESYDQATDVLRVDVREAEHFIPPAGMLEVYNAANAVFTKGSAELLVPGQYVEIKGAWEAPLFTAALIEIEGALPARSREDRSHGYDDLYAEVKGRVERLDGGQVTLAVVAAEHFDGGGPGTTLTIDTSGAWFKYGAAECLEPGAYIEAKGAVESGVLVAVVVEVESACGKVIVVDDSAADPSRDRDGDDDHSGDRDNDRRSERAEIKGVIDIVAGGMATVTWFRAEYFRPADDQVQVDVSDAWYEYGSAGDLAAGRVVEMEGRWDGNRLHATKVEFK